MFQFLYTLKIPYIFFKTSKKKKNLSILIKLSILTKSTFYYDINASIKTEKNK